jgi:protein SCO1/2
MHAITCRLLVILTILLAGSAQALPKAPEPHHADYHGGLVSPPMPKPEFTLTDTTGAPFNFAARTQGHLTLLFFGYTYCPDLCPLEMFTISQALKKLPASVADEIKVVFVTTDPGRDTPQVLRTWLDNFSKHFIGLTGSDAAIRAAQIAANIPPATKSAVRPDGSYDVGHAAFVLAYTKDNKAHVIYPVGVTADDLAADLPLLAQETWSSH